MPSKIIPMDVAEGMIAVYLAGATAKEAAAKFGLSPTACLNAMKKAGVDRRTSGETKFFEQFNPRYFQSIDEEAKAYWLGFISADGNINETHGITVCLSQVDVDHLRSLQRAVSLTREPKWHTRSMWCVHFSSRYLIEDCKILGVCCLKPERATPPVQVPSELLRHYWRGVFDADGSIVKASRSSDWLVTLTGPANFTGGFLRYVKTVWPTNSTVRPVKDKNSFRLTLCGTNMPRAVLRSLYRGAVVSLPRKHQRAIEACNGSL